MKKEQQSLKDELEINLYLIRKSPLSLVGLLIITCFIIIAIFGPLIVPYIKYTNPENRLKPPSFANPFGTDDLGRDIFSRVVWGTRISFFIGFFTVGLTIVIGTSLGLVAGYGGRFVEEIIMRTTDVFLSIPALILAMIVMAALGANIVNALWAISFTRWPVYTRIVRAMTLSIREQPFVEASIALNASTKHILIRHILPNLLGPIVVQASSDVGRSILTLAALGFIGLGTKPPTPEWGLMIATGRHYVPKMWWCSFFPGAAIFFAALGFNLLGDALRDILDPKLRR